MGHFRGYILLMKFYRIMKSHNNKIIYLITTVVFLTFINILQAQNRDEFKQMALSLRGKWKFSIGERNEWTMLGFDDSNWEEIYAPSSWEEQGFYGYNGFGFYRKVIVIPEEYEKYDLYLHLGYIDDVDEVYLNGEKIGSSGKFPPHIETAYNAKREYSIPKDKIRFGRENVIAVKVYDSHHQGGIISGDIGLYRNMLSLDLDINLQGTWKFKTGDNPNYAAAAFRDDNWADVQVPGFWENQGFNNYNGMGWYRKTFTVNKRVNTEKLVIILGYIDDIDEVYLNGEKVGATGNFKNLRLGRRGTGEWIEFRGYYINTEKLKQGKNTIAVRVFDWDKGGGIYQGPIGIVTQEKYIQYWKERRQIRQDW